MGRTSRMCSRLGGLAQTESLTHANQGDTMKNISTETGLCVLGVYLASHPIIDRVMPRAEVGATHVATVFAAVREHMSSDKRTL
jgi:hypothetical protein